MRSMVLALCIALSACSPAGRSWRLAQHADTADGYATHIQIYGTDKTANLARVRLEQLHWEQAVTKQDEPSYRFYIAQHAGGPHLREAQQALQRLRFEAAISDGSVGALESYLATYPNSEQSEAARVALEESMWLDAVEVDTARAYGDYVVRWPQGSHLAEALQRREAAYWSEQLEVDTIQSYEAYLNRYPEGPHVDEARAAIDTFNFSRVDVLVVLEQTWRTGDNRQRTIEDFRKEISKTYTPWLKRNRFGVRLLPVQVVIDEPTESWWLRVDSPSEDAGLLVIRYREAKGERFDPYGYGTNAEAALMLMPPGRAKPLWTKRLKAQTGESIRGSDLWALNRSAQRQLATKILDTRPPLRDYQRALY